MPRQRGARDVTEYVGGGVRALPRHRCADQPMGHLGAGEAVQQIDVDQGQGRALAVGDGEGALRIHGATDHVAPGIRENEFQFHRKYGLILDDHDPEIRQC